MGRNAYDEVEGGDKIWRFVVQRQSNPHSREKEKQTSNWPSRVALPCQRPWGLGRRKEGPSYCSGRTRGGGEKNTKKKHVTEIQHSFYSLIILQKPKGKGGA